VAFFNKSQSICKLGARRTSKKNKQEEQARRASKKSKQEEQANKPKEEGVLHERLSKEQRSIRESTQWRALDTRESYNSLT
jgi:hypothetical protein